MSEQLFGRRLNFIGEKGDGNKGESKLNFTSETRFNFSVINLLYEKSPVPFPKNLEWTLGVSPGRLVPGGWNLSVCYFQWRIQIDLGGRQSSAEANTQNLLFCFSFRNTADICEFINFYSY